MNRYSLYLKISEALGVALGISLTSYCLKLFDSENSFIFVVFALFSIVVVRKLFEYFFNELYDRVVCVRNFVHGSDYLEGNWLDYAKHNFGLINISYASGTIMIHGDAFNYDSGELMYTWDSEFCTFDGINLKYVYKTIASTEGNECEQELGFSKVSFSRLRPRTNPNRFTGMFFNFAEKNGIHSIRGIKLNNEDADKIRQNFNHAKKFLGEISTESQPNLDLN